MDVRAEELHNVFIQAEQFQGLPSGNLFNT
jgi:hypothetical protein